MGHERSEGTEKTEFICDWLLSMTGILLLMSYLVSRRCSNGGLFARELYKIEELLISTISYGQYSINKEPPCL